MKRLSHRLIVVVCVVILTALPARLIARHYSSESGFVGLILFGRNLKDSVMPEISELARGTSSKWGYDGQYYAQLALSPGLRDPHLAGALDSPEYRARRIGLPLLAFTIGFGNPEWILQVYALLNVFFWIALLAGIIRFIGLKRPRDLLLAISLLWPTGTLVSLLRSLTDFPATVLGVFAVFCESSWIAAAILLATSGLIRETSVLSFAAVPLATNSQGIDRKRLMLSSLILFIPISAWSVYVQLRFPSVVEAGSGNFALPLFGVTEKLWSSFQRLELGGNPFEFLSPLSLLIQATYLLWKPRIRSQAWRFGFGFVLLLVILGKSVWAEQYAYCRVLLPLTFAFNLLIHRQESGPRFATWYLLGNGGMLWLAIRPLLS